jgi:hypothetical protein
LAGSTRGKYTYIYICFVGVQSGIIGKGLAVNPGRKIALARSRSRWNNIIKMVNVK